MIPTNLPMFDFGKKSPYPTVVIVIRVNQNALLIVLKSCPEASDKGRSNILNMNPKSAIESNREQTSTEYGFFFINDLIVNMNDASDPLIWQTLWDLTFINWERVREHLTIWYVRKRHIINRNMSFTLFEIVAL